MPHPGFVSTASTETRRLQIVCHTRQEITDDLHASHMSKVVMQLVFQSATEWTASVHTSHMSKVVM